MRKIIISEKKEIELLLFVVFRGTRKISPNSRNKYTQPNSAVLNLSLNLYVSVVKK